jgi:hypothetical protein
MVTESRLRDQSTSDEHPVPQLSSVTALQLQTSSVGAGSQMVTESRLRDQSTSDVRPALHPSLVTISELRISEAGANSQMVAESRLWDQSTFVGQPVSQPSLILMPDTRPNLSMVRDELLPSSGSDTSRPRAPLEETVRPRTLVRSFEAPISAHVVNAEVVLRPPGPSFSTIPSGGSLEAGPVVTPQLGSTAMEGPSGAIPRGGGALRPRSSGPAAWVPAPPSGRHRTPPKQTGGAQRIGGRRPQHSQLRKRPQQAERVSHRNGPGLQHREGRAGPPTYGQPTSPPSGSGAQRNRSVKRTGKRVSRSQRR